MPRTDDVWFLSSTDFPDLGTGLPEDLLPVRSDDVSEELSHGATLALHQIAPTVPPTLSIRLPPHPVLDKPPTGDLVLGDRGRCV